MNEAGEIGIASVASKYNRSERDFSVPDSKVVINLVRFE